MRRFISIFFVLSVLFIAVSCEEEQKPTEQKKFNNELKTFNKTLEGVDEPMNVMDKMQDEYDKVDKDLSKGNISESDAKRLKENISTEYSEELVKSANNTPTRHLPQWAKDLGLTEPSGLTVDREMSQMTSETNPGEGYNSVLLYYKPNYRVAMKQASIIANKAGIPMTKEYKMAKELEKEVGETILKGVAYMNFDLGDQSLPKYTIAITVDEKGVLAISANDASQLSSELDLNK